MYLAVSDLYRARWSNMIHEEWIRNVLKDKPDIEREKLNRIRNLMDQNAPDALVSGFENLISGLELSDPDDRHVLACAIHCGAEVIVTANLKDFPDDALASYGVKAVHPDEFLLDMLELNPGEFIHAVSRHRRSLKNPPHSQDQYLDALLKHRLPETVSALRKYHWSI